MRQREWNFGSLFAIIVLKYRLFVCLFFIVLMLFFFVIWSRIYIFSGVTPSFGVTPDGAQGLLPAVHSGISPDLVGTKWDVRNQAQTNHVKSKHLNPCTITVLYTPPPRMEYLKKKKKAEIEWQINSHKIIFLWSAF